MNKRAEDDDLARELWDRSERLLALTEPTRRSA